AVGKVDEEFATHEMQLFRLNRQLTKLFGGVPSRPSRQEKDMEFRRLDVASLGEGVARSDGAQIGYAAENHRRTANKLFFNRLVDAGSYKLHIALHSIEDNITALHIGLGLLKFQRHEECTERLHFDDGVTADIDTAKETDQDGHGNSSAFAIERSQHVITV